VPHPKPWLLSTPLEPHGGPDGSAEGELRDFSVNSNPFGPPPELLSHLRAVPLAAYPDPTYRRARAAVAAHHGELPERVVLGSAAELIYRLAACYLRPGDAVLIATPTFGEYARASRLQGARVVTCPAYRRGAPPDAAALARALRDVRPALVWLCHPNNPTGHAWETGVLHDLAERCAAQGALLVLDAAYLELSERCAPAELPAGTVQLFALTKTFAVAGLRAGYALAPAEVAEVLRRAAPPWSVSAPAEAAVRWCRSPAAAAFVRGSLPRLLAERRALQRGLRALELRVWESVTTFFLVEVGNAGAVSARARAAGFRLRDTSSLGLSSCVRLAAGQPDDNRRLLAAFPRFLAGGNRA
jgi:histidinol-phosphate aminotransferase